MPIPFALISRTQLRFIIILPIFLYQSTIRHLRIPANISRSIHHITSKQLYNLFLLNLINPLLFLLLSHHQHILLLLINQLFLLLIDYLHLSIILFINLFLLFFKLIHPPPHLLYTFYSNPITNLLLLSTTNQPIYFFSLLFIFYILFMNLP